VTREQRQRRARRQVQIAFVISVVIVVGTFYALSLGNVSPISLGGLLILGGVAAFLWRFWSDTLRAVRLSLREPEEPPAEQSVEDLLAEAEQPAAPPDPPDPHEPPPTEAEPPAERTDNRTGDRPDEQR
jgi:hypothetical protein